MSENMKINMVIRESLTIALIQLMQKKPFHSITISELTQRAGVGRVSFYRNYSSKEDILTSYFAGRKKQWDLDQKKWTQEHPQQEYDVILGVFNLFYQNRAFIQLLYQADLSHILMKCLLNSNGPKPDQPNHLAYWNAKLTGGLFFWCDEWVRRGMQETPEEMRQLVPQMVRNALLPEGTANTSLWEKIIEIDCLVMGK